MLKLTFVHKNILLAILYMLLFILLIVSKNIVALLIFIQLRYLLSYVDVVCFQHFEFIPDIFHFPLTQIKISSWIFKNVNDFIKWVLKCFKLCLCIIFITASHYLFQYLCYLYKYYIIFLQKIINTFYIMQLNAIKYT